MAGNGVFCSVNAASWLRFYFWATKGCGNVDTFHRIALTIVT
jgi:hypothetical protein